jgi:hypothetical protein
VDETVGPNHDRGVLGWQMRPPAKQYQIACP